MGIWPRCLVTESSIVSAGDESGRCAWREVQRKVPGHPDAGARWKAATGHMSKNESDLVSVLAAPNIDDDIR